MESKKWLWIVIVCLAIIAVYQIVKLTGGNTTDSPSPQVEPSFQPDQRTTHTASLAELPGMLEEKKQPVINITKAEKPQEPNTVTIESSAQNPEEQEQDTIEAANTVAMQDPLSPDDDQPIANTNQALPATISMVKSSNRGLVRGLVCSEDHGSALIDETIVQTGAIIENVEVVNIDADGIEFEKEDQRWTQKVGDAPDVRWQ